MLTIVRKGDAMKILIVVINSQKYGGHRTISKLANEWIKMGHSVYLLNFKDSEEVYFPTAAQTIYVDTDGKRCHQDVLAKIPLVKKLLGITRFLHRESNIYDVVIATHNITAYPVWFASRSCNFYYVQAYEPEFHNSASLRSILLKLVAKFTYNLPLVRVVNAEIYKCYKNLHSKYVIPPGLDLDLYYPQVNYWDKKRPFVIGCIGRVEEWKGSADVADAVRMLQSKGANIHFKVAFNSIDCNDYELVHPDGDENLSAYYRSLDVLVAPAKLQLGAIHYPVIEAMASGTTVITTGYYPANLENSYIVPVSDPIAIAETIEEIMENYENAIEKTNKALSEIQRFDWKKVSSDFFDIFDQEINKNDNAK